MKGYNVHVVKRAMRRIDKRMNWELMSCNNGDDVLMDSVRQRIYKRLEAASIKYDTIEGRGFEFIDGFDPLEEAYQEIVDFIIYTCDIAQECDISSDEKKLLSELGGDAMQIAKMLEYVLRLRKRDE